MTSSKTAAGNAGGRTLFIPGPTWVDPEARAAMDGDMMGHRSPAFRELLASSQPVLRDLAGTARPVYLATCSSWGMMEAAVRNLVRPGRRALNCCCGAFSDRWHQATLACGIEADALRVTWGESIEAPMLRRVLEAGSYDLVTLVHAETSTGVLNPLEELAAVVSEFPETRLAVDVVSSYSAFPLRMDQWKIDALMAGTQKALALPPGMTVCAVSERALERAAVIPARGFYFDFLEYERNARSDMTISTPCIPLVMGLAHRAREIASEGLAARFERHERCRRHVETWALRHGWMPLPSDGRRAPTLNCLLPPGGVDAAVFAGRLRDHTGLIIDPGYGALKGRTVRISNMGVQEPEQLNPLLDAMDMVL